MLDALPSVHLLNAILVLMALEAVVLLAIWGRHRRGIAPADLLPMLLAGFALMLALRFSVAGTPAPALLACLTLAGLAHILDLVRRWRR